MNETSIKKNNKGSALIVCIIILLFVSILATVILYMSGINYRMKASEFKTKESFYSGEVALERIQGNLVIPVSEALDIAYRRTNNRYASLGTEEARQQYFYDTFYEEFKEIMIKQYGGSSIGSSGETLTNATLIKNIIHNLTYNYDTTSSGVHSVSSIVGPIIPGTGVVSADYSNSANRIFCNDYYSRSLGIAYTDYSSYPYGFIQALESHDKLNGSVGVSDLYIVCPTQLDYATADDLFAHFADNRYLTTTDPDSAIGAVLDPNKRRLLLKNICVVVVHENGYRSIISTDIAIQMPPVQWSMPGSSVGYQNWDVYQLIYYVNWKKS